MVCRFYRVPNVLELEKYCYESYQWRFTGSFYCTYGLKNQNLCIDSPGFKYYNLINQMVN